MKRLRRIHLYLGCIFAPMLIFFAATGAGQMIGIRSEWLTRIHNQGNGSLFFRLLAAAMGLSVVVTAILGVVMAFRLGDDRKTVWACVAFGSLLPVVVLLIEWLKS